MHEIYKLNEENLPTVPEPHDCVVKEIKLENNNLIFVFENDISYHDSIKAIRPSAKSLTISYHLLDNIYDINLFVRTCQSRLLHRFGSYKEIDIAKNISELLDLPNSKGGLCYLYHYVRYNTVIVKLWSSNEVVLELTVDFIVFDWQE